MGKIAKRSPNCIKVAGKSSPRSPHTDTLEALFSNPHSMSAKTKPPIALPSEFQAKIEIWGIDRVIPYPLNNKQHPPEQIAKLAGLIKTFGWDVPIVVDDGGIVLKGHCRRLAAIQLGLSEVPVIVRRELSEADKRALRIADNRVAESPWDDEALKAEIAALAELDYDLSLTGFEELELNSMLDGLDFGDGQDEEAIAPEEDEAALQDLEEDLEAAESGELEVRVKPGEIWRLGRHFICCGDSTDEGNIRKLLEFGGDRKVGFVWSDAPYGINIVATNEPVGGGEAYDIPFGGVKNRKGYVGGVTATEPRSQNRSPKK